MTDPRSSSRLQDLIDAAFAVGTLTTIATGGALLGLGMRDGEAGRAFRLAGRGLLESIGVPSLTAPLTSVALGYLHHLIVATAWGVLLAMVVLPQRGLWRVVVAIIAAAVYTMVAVSTAACAEAPMREAIQKSTRLSMLSATMVATLGPARSRSSFRSAVQCGSADAGGGTGFTCVISVIGPFKKKPEARKLPAVSVIRSRKWELRRGDSCDNSDVDETDVHGHSSRMAEEHPDSRSTLSPLEGGIKLGSVIATLTWSFSRSTMAIDERGTLRSCDRRWCSGAHVGGQPARPCTCAHGAILSPRTNGPGKYPSGNTGNCRKSHRLRVPTLQCIIP